jgi:hypothetical protein
VLMCGCARFTFVLGAPVLDAMEAEQQDESRGDGGSGASRSHAMGWTLAVLAVPVLYVLTLPPIAVIGMRLGVDKRWVDVYAAPANWLYSETPLRKPLDTYGAWWGKLLPDPRVP